MKLTAKVQCSGRWWAAGVPELPGLFTQARRINQVKVTVKEAAVAHTGQPPSRFEVQVAPTRTRHAER